MALIVVGLRLGERELRSVLCLLSKVRLYVAVVLYRLAGWCQEAAGGASEKDFVGDLLCCSRDRGIQRRKDVRQHTFLIRLFQLRADECSECVYQRLDASFCLFVRLVVGC